MVFLVTFILFSRDFLPSIGQTQKNDNGRGKLKPIRCVFQGV